MHDRRPQPTPPTALTTPDTATLHTAATAIRLIPDWADLTPTRRRDLISALLTTARWAGLPPENLGLDPQDLRVHIEDFAGAPLDTTESRKRNILASLRYVLRRLGLIDPDDAPVSEAWLACLERLRSRDRDGMVVFARYCSARQITPPAVSVATLTAFLGHLTMRSLARKPRKRVGAMRTSWNRACRLADWPGTPLAELTDPDDYILPLAAFPLEFQEQLAAFGARMSQVSLDDPFDDDRFADPDDGQALLARPARPVRASTAALRMAHLRWAASALVKTGVPIGTLTDPLLLVTPLERVRLILRFLYRLKGNKPSAAGMHVAEVLMILVRHHVRRRGKPEVVQAALAADVARIKRWNQTVRLTYEGMTQKNEDCVRAVLHPAREIRLRELPPSLMQAARSLRATSPAEAASLAFRGTVIQFHRLNPLRVSNVCGLRLDQHLQRADPGRGLITHLVIDAAETKNKRKIIMQVSRETGRVLEEWIRDFRPLIAAPGCPFLFPGHGTGNRPITRQSMGEAIRTTTKAHLGVAVSPHQFRHLAACAYLEEFPGAYEMVKLLLGHATVQTVIRSYASQESKSSQELFDDLMLRRGKRLGRKKPLPTPRKKGR